MTASDDWHVRAQQLADDLEQAGKLTDPRWRDAVTAVPRHALVPEFYRQDRSGRWITVDSASPEGRETVYSNSVLITALRETNGGTSQCRRRRNRG